jgi:ParB/RepB/Spo0J family partition protein
MADLKSVAESRSAVFNMDPRKLVLRDDWNARDMRDPDNVAHVKELEASIESEGVREPLTVVMEGDEVVVKNGYCRTTAVNNLLARGVEIATVPCITEPRGSNDADHVFSQILRNSGKPLSPFEQGRVYKRLIAFGWTAATIATKSGKSVAHVNQALQLQQAPAEVQQLVATGDVSATLAAKVIRQSGAKEGAVKLAKAVKAAKAAGKSHATEKHVEPEAPRQIDIEQAIAASPADAPLNLTPCETRLVAAMRKIAALADNATIEVARFMANEALIEAGIAA